MRFLHDVSNIWAICRSVSYKFVKEIHETLNVVLLQFASAIKLNGIRYCLLIRRNENSFAVLSKPFDNRWWQYTIQLFTFCLLKMVACQSYSTYLGRGDCNSVRS